VAKDASGAVLEDRSWVYDGQLRVIAEINASGALRARYLYASSGHSPDVALTFDPNTGEVTGSYLLVHDQVGSVVRTVDLATGLAVEAVEYDPWGVATVSPGGSSVHPFGFAGGLWDRRTGLVRYGAREYDAGLGRWLARDPIGFAGGWNHYAYAAGDPVGMVDPTGLWPDGPPSSLPGHSSSPDLERESAWDAFTTVLPWLIPESMALKLLPFWRSGKACSAAAKAVAKEGIYEFIAASGKKYVGQSGNIPRRLGEHARSGKLPEGAEVVTRHVPGGKAARQVVEQRRIDELGGIGKLEYEVNPIGPGRRHLWGGD
jgi:RHS repeat-associated protein